MFVSRNGMVSLFNRFLSDLFSKIKIRFISFNSMEGGELFQRIQDRQDGAFTERGRSQF